MEFEVSLSTEQGMEVRERENNGGGIGLGKGYLSVIWRV